MRPRSHGERVAPHGHALHAQEAIGGFGAVDDADEATFPDPSEPEDAPTTIRPSPLPASLVVREVTVERNSSRGFSASLRGRVGKYELRAKLGRGAFGVVFTARDPSLDRDVAIKVLRPAHLANQEIVQRFLQEARATARISHPGIVTIHDCGRVETGSGSTAFIAMELLSGESLTSRLLRCGRLASGTAAEIVRQVASALEAAHRADVLHRDLKPDNIYLVPDPAMPSGERVKVLDFGLAKLGQGVHTQLQTVFGTPRYMSPEQCRSAAQVDHRSDIYALGCILFELVTGRLPFDGDVRQLIERHQHATAPRATSFVPELSRALDDLIAEMLAKDPMDRPQTMGAVQRALYHVLSPEGSTTEPDVPRPGESGAIGTDPTRPRGARSPELSPPERSRPELPLPPDVSRTPERSRPELVLPPDMSRPPERSRPELPLPPEPSRPAELPRPPDPALARPPDPLRARELSRPSEHPRPPERSGPTEPPAGSMPAMSAAGSRDIAIGSDGRGCAPETTEIPRAYEPGAPSGEILVPATGADTPSDRAPSGDPAAPRRRRAVLVCVATLALIAAAVLAAVATV